MSSPVSGEDLEKLAKKPGVVTWAALAALIQLGGLVLPGAMRLQAIETTVNSIEKDGSPALQRHIVDSNSRYTEIIRQLTRIEAKLGIDEPPRRRARAKRIGDYAEMRTSEAEAK